MTDLHEKWKLANGDDTYALDWDINSESLVWEIGGFEGRWAAQIAEKFDSFIDIFEPTDFGFGRCSQRFFDNKKITINHYGLWVMDAHLPLYNPGNDSGSLLLQHPASEVCKFGDIYLELIDERVDLCLMNVEGAEFALLPYMIANGLMENIRYFWCQFHRFVPDADERYVSIKKRLEETHRMMWEFYPTAVAWERKR